MTQIVRYLTHPQVIIDPATPVPQWSLSAVGVQRVTALARSNALAGTRHVISSAETKAVETATPLANALGCPLEVRERMHENDRSATGFLPPEKFEVMADRFFSRPTESADGWETATAAQTRIWAEVQACLRRYTESDILFVGHGAVGTLLWCHLSGLPISRQYDQPRGGGCIFAFQAPDSAPTSGWQPMEHLTSPDTG